MLNPIIPEICKDASISESAVEYPYQVLDIAAGPGDLSIAIAEKLGPTATIWCTDLVPEMVRIAERSAAERGVRNVRCRESRAEVLPFDSSSFDAVVCRFGIMFFSDPPASVRESLRLLKTGGRVCHCVWGARRDNPFHHVVQDVLDRYVAGPAPEPDAPGAFRFAESGKLVKVFDQAGASAIRERRVRFNIAAPLSFDEFFEVRTEMSDSLRAKLRKLAPEQAASFKQDVQQNAESYFTSEGFSFPAEVLLVSGAKS